MSDWLSLQGYEEVWHRWCVAAGRAHFPAVHLFVAGPGRGMRLWLHRAAAVFFCEHQQACGRCASCRSIRHDEAPDLWQPESGGGCRAADAAPLHEFLLQRAAPGRRRVVVIPELELAHVSFLNKLLKILEEPPTGACILLATSQWNAILPTVRSRCVTWRLPPLSDELQVAIVKQGAGVSLAATDIAEVLKLAGGAPGLALDILNSEQKESLQTRWRKLQTLLTAPALATRLAACEEYCGLWAERFLEPQELIWIEHVLSEAYRKDPAAAKLGVPGAIGRRRRCLARLHRRLRGQGLAVQRYPALVAIASCAEAMI